jgi:ABC-type phosphate transport system substrate-binding protein
MVIQKLLYCPPRQHCLDTSSGIGSLLTAKFNYVVVWFLFCLFFSLSNTGFAAVLSGRDEVIVIANKQVGEEIISRAALRSLFSMRSKFWKNELPVKVVVLSDDNSLHIDFVKTNLNIFPYQLRQTWDRLIFSGVAQAPIELKSDTDIKMMVAKTPGTIGYIRRSQLDNTVKEMKVE